MPEPHSQQLDEQMLGVGVAHFIGNIRPSIRVACWEHCPTLAKETLELLTNSRNPA